ncbi:MAG: hypothetical protein ACKKMR_01000 [Candidatus Nealsonbacteria bacterium]
MRKIIINTAKEISAEEKQILKNIFREESLEIGINASFMRFSGVEILPLVIELSVTAIKVVLGGVAYDTLKRIVKKILSNRRIKRNKEIIIKKREKTFVVTSKGFYLRSKKENSVFRNIDEFFEKMEKGK